MAAAKRMRAALEVSEETGGNTGPDDMDFLASLPPMPDDDEDDALLFDSVVAPAVRQAKYEAAEATEKGGAFRAFWRTRTAWKPACRSGGCAPGSPC